jgi:hypothetical protein
MNPRYFLLTGLLWANLAAPGIRCAILTPEDSYKSAHTVFVGEVVKLTPEDEWDSRLTRGVAALERPVTARLKIERVYRGERTEEVEVETMTGGAEWGADFKPGEKYLVYAHARKVGERIVLVVRGCGRTRLLSQAQEDLNFLDTLPAQATTP